jgi:lipopolysaccharide transport protein LptA
MEYRVGDGVIELHREAEVLQGGDSLAGGRVTYDTVNSQVRAMSAGGADDRVRVILTPRPKEAQGPGGGRR